MFELQVLSDELDIDYPSQNMFNGPDVINAMFYAYALPHLRDVAGKVTGISACGQY